MKNFCKCENDILIYMGSFNQRGAHWQDESYPVHCYYCASCGKELLIYTGHHDEESKEHYVNSQKYSFLNRSSHNVIDATQLNPDISESTLQEKRQLIKDIIDKKGIYNDAGALVITSYKKK